MARRDIKYARKSQIGGTGSTTLNNFQDNGLSGEVLYNSGAVLASSATGVDITGDLDVTGDSTLGGNVGIGTASPTAVLDIVNTNPKIRLQDSDLVNVYAEVSGNGGHFTFIADGTNSEANSRIAFDIDGTEKMRLTSTGNLGIGQTPTADLHLNADATTTNAFQIEADTVTTGNVIDVVNADALTTGGILDLVSNSADAGTRSLVTIHNDHASATGTTALDITNDADSLSMKVTGGEVLINPAFAKGLVIGEGGANNHLGVEVWNFGTKRVVIEPYGPRLYDQGSIAWSGSTTAGDLKTQIHQDSEGIIGLRVGTTAHGINIYNTYTDASNYERLALKWDTNVFKVETEAAGTGTVRDIEVVGDTTVTGNIAVTGTVDGRDIASDGTTQDSHIADATLHFTEGSIDHGSIAGLADDDHTQYLLVDGTRALTDNLLFSDATGAVIDVTTNSSTLTIQGRDSLSATNTLGFFDPDGAVEFYYDGDKVFSTVNAASGFDGVRIHGISGSERPTVVLTDSAGSDKAVLAAWNDGQTYFDNRVDPSTGGGDIVMRTANHTGATILNATLTLKAETANGANDERIIAKHGFADTLSTYDDGNGPGLSVFGTAPAIWIGDDDSMTNPYFFLRRAGTGKINMRAMNPTDDFDLTTRTGDDLGNDIQIKMHGETGSGTNDAYVSLYHNNVQVAYTVADGFVIGDQAGASGDQFLKIIADNDNAVEASNAYIQLEQDGSVVVAQIGTTASANQFSDGSSITIGSGSGIPANSLVIGNKFSSAGLGFVVGSTAELIITSTGCAFNGKTPVAVPTYTVTNDVTDRTYDANSTSVAELADVLGTLIADLQANGLLN